MTLEEQRARRAGLRARLEPLARAGLSMQEAGEKVGLSAAAVGNLSRPRNEEKRIVFRGKTGRRRRLEWREAVRLRKAGMTLKKIGETLGCTRERVRQIVLTVNGGPIHVPIDTTNRRAVDYQLVHDMRMAGMNSQKIADALNVSVNLVWSVLSKTKNGVEYPRIVTASRKHDYRLAFEMRREGATHMEIAHALGLSGTRQPAAIVANILKRIREGAPLD